MLIREIIKRGGTLLICFVVSYHSIVAVILLFRLTHGFPDDLSVFSIWLAAWIILRGLTTVVAAVFMGVVGICSLGFGLTYVIKGSSYE